MTGDAVHTLASSRAAIQPAAAPPPCFVRAIPFPPCNMMRPHKYFRPEVGKIRALPAVRKSRRKNKLPGGAGRLGRQWATIDRRRGENAKSLGVSLASIDAGRGQPDQRAVHGPPAAANGADHTAGQPIDRILYLQAMGPSGGTLVRRESEPLRLIVYCGGQTYPRSLGSLTCGRIRRTASAVGLSGDVATVRIEA